MAQQLLAFSIRFSLPGNPAAGRTGSEEKEKGLPHWKAALSPVLLSSECGVPESRVGTLKKLANTELVESLAGLNLGRLLEALDRFLCHFIFPSLLVRPSGALLLYLQLARQSRHCEADAVKAIESVHFRPGATAGGPNESPRR